MLRRLPPVVLNLLIINGLFYLGTYALNNLGYNIGEVLGIHYFDSSLFKPYQILTSMFTHGSFGHFFFNMFALFMFGGVLERRMGSMDFLKFYLICGLGATFLHMGVQAYEVYDITGSIFNDFVIKGDRIEFFRSFSEAEGNKLARLYITAAVGASGALYGLLIAFAMFFPNEELMLIFLPVPIKAKYFMPALIAIDFYLGLANYSWDPIAHFAHLGGALFGFLLIKFWFNRKRHDFR